MAVKRNSISVSNDEVLTCPSSIPVTSTLYIPPKKYEYTRASDNSMKFYNEMGTKGWRLVHIEGTWTTWEREIV